MFSGDQLSPVNASMSSVYHRFGNYYSAERCMDGEHIGSNSICQTEKELAPWIAFDFAKEVEVGSVIIFSRHDERAEQIVNLDVRMTDDLPEDGDSKFTDGKSLGSFNGTLTQCQRIVIMSPDLLKGRYVLIQMSHGSEDHLSFQVVTIYNSTEVSAGLFCY